MTDPHDPHGPFRGFRFEVDPDRVRESLEGLSERLRGLVDAASQGLATSQNMKVRVRYKGKQVGPDLPLQAVLLGEGVVFALLSPLVAVLLNVGATAVLEVEVVHEGDELVASGQVAYQAGEVEEAEAAYRAALRLRPDDPAALYHLGVLLRVTGRGEEAVRCWRKAAMGPESVPEVAKAAAALDRWSGKRTL